MPPTGVVIDRCANCPVRHRSAFADLSESDLVEIDRARSLVTFDSGAVLSSSADDKPGFYCVRSGYMKVSVGRSPRSCTARICGPGELVEYGNWYSARSNVIASFEGAQACFFLKDAFLALQARSSAVNNGIIQMLCKIIASKEYRISVLENCSVKNRVAALILSLLEKFGTSDDVIDIAIDRPTLAHLAGTVPETIARVITVFEKDGLLKREGRKIRVLDRKSLIAAIEQ